MKKEQAQECLIVIERAISALQDCAELDQFFSQSRERDTDYVRAILLLQNKKERALNMLKNSS